MRTRPYTWPLAANKGKILKKTIIPSLLVVMLAACNGGGGGGSSAQSEKTTTNTTNSNDNSSNVEPLTVNSLPGLYSGTVTSSASSMEFQSAAILGEDGSLYFTSPDQCPTFSGKYQSKAGVLSGEGVQAKTYTQCSGFNSSSVSNAVLQGSESTAGVSGTITYEFNSGADNNVVKTTKAFSLSRSAQASTPRLLAEVAGNYVGFSNRLRISIDANGVITGSFDDSYPLAFSGASKTANCNGLLSVSRTYNLGTLDLACYNTGNGHQSLSMKGNSVFSKNQTEKKVVYAMFDYWIYDTAYVVGETKRVGSMNFVEQ